MPITPMPENPIDAFGAGLAQSQAIFDSLMQNRVRRAEAKRAEAKAKLPFGGEIYPGVAGQITGLEAIKQAYGENSHQYQQASKAFDLSQSSINSRVNYQNTLAESMPLRLTTPTGRSIIEQSNVEGGYSPAGTPQGQPISPGQAPYYSPGQNTALTQNPNGTNTVTNTLSNDYKRERLNKNLPESDKKALIDATTSYETTQNIEDSLLELKQQMKNPRYKNIAGTLEGYALNAKPLGIPVGALLKNVYPKEDQELLGKTSALMGNVVVAVGQQFKGPYRNMVNGLINQMKPNFNDPIEVQMGKVDALITLSRLGQQRKELISKYITENGMSSIEAMLKADKEIPFSKIKKQVEEASMQRQQESEPMDNQNQTQNNKPISILYKDGKEYHIPTNLMGEALKAGFTNDR